MIDMYVSRPDRQTLMFSATMKSRVEGFAREALRDPVRIQVSEYGGGCTTVLFVCLYTYECLYERMDLSVWCMCGLHVFVCASVHM